MHRHEHELRSAPCIRKTENQRPVSNQPKKYLLLIHPERQAQKVNYQQTQVEEKREDPKSALQ